MKIIKANYFSGNCYYGTLSYTIGKQDYDVCGEFYYNSKKDRYEHVHFGRRGGVYLIVW